MDTFEFVAVNESYFIIVACDLVINEIGELYPLYSNVGFNFVNVVKHTDIRINELLKDIYKNCPELMQKNVLEFSQMAVELSGCNIPQYYTYLCDFYESLKNENLKRLRKLSFS